MAVFVKFTHLRVNLPFGQRPGQRLIQGCVVCSSGWRFSYVIACVAFPLHSTFTCSLSRFPVISIKLTLLPFLDVPGNESVGVAPPWLGHLWMLARDSFGALSLLPLRECPCHFLLRRFWSVWRFLHRRPLRSLSSSSLHFSSHFLHHQHVQTWQLLPSTLAPFSPFARGEVVRHIPC